MPGRGFEALLAWYFVTVWGSGFVATKIGIQYAAPFTTSILGVNALHTLMRRGQATRVTSLIYLTPIFAVAMELALFDIVPSVLAIAGIVVTCLGVALVTWRRLDTPSA
jgi:drug/metabolite transporter (DMT)-like permease